MKEFSKDKRLKGMTTKYHKFEANSIHHILAQALLKLLTRFACLYYHLPTIKKWKKKKSTEMKRVTRDAEAKVTNSVSTMVYTCICMLCNTFI
jgi:hypothetical protein